MLRGHEVALSGQPTQNGVCAVSVRVLGAHFGASWGRIGSGSGSSSFVARIVLVGFRSRILVSFW